MPEQPSFKASVRKLMVKNAPRIFFVSITFIVISTIMSEFEFRLPDTAAAYNIFLNRISAGEIPTPEIFYSSLRSSGIAFAVVLLLFQQIIKVGYMSYSLKIARGQDAGYKDILNGFLFFMKIIYIKIISTFFILLWSVLFFFPAIPAYYRYRQAYFILLDAPEKGAFQCIRESRRLMVGNKLNLFLLDLSFIGWFIIDFIVVLLLPLPFALPIVSIWLTPYYGLTQAIYYDNLISNLVV